MFSVHTVVSSATDHPALQCTVSKGSLDVCLVQCHSAATSCSSGDLEL